MRQTIVPMESVSLRLYSDAYPRGTGKHPTINVETQIPLELDQPLSNDYYYSANI